MLGARLLCGEQESHLWDCTLHSQLLVVDAVGAGHNFVHIVCAGKGHKAKAPMRLLGSGWILGDVCILQCTLHLGRGTQAVFTLC